MVSLSCFFPILSYSKASLSQHIFTGPHIFSFHSKIGHQENIKPFEWLSPYFYAVPTQLLVIASWILPNSIFSFLVSFKYYSDKFYLRLSPTSVFLLGLWTWSRLDYTQQSSGWEHYISTHHLHIRLRSWLPLCICLPVCSAKHIMADMACAWDVSLACARLRSLAVRLGSRLASWARIRCFGWVFEWTNEWCRVDFIVRVCRCKFHRAQFPIQQFLLQSCHSLWWRQALPLAGTDSDAKPQAGSSRWQIPALCARTAPQQMSSTGQLSSATLPHQNLATLRNWASGRSMSRPVPATSWPEPGARRAPRRTSDISQPVRVTWNSKHGNI